MDNKLTSTIAIITGAAQGIGAAIAQRFVQEGCFVYVTDVNDVLGRATVTALGDRACYLDLDVRCEEDWQRVTTHVLKTHGRLDVVVNNAGITGFEEGAVQHDPEHASLEDWRAVHRTNLDGVVLGCKYAIRAMRRTGTGSISIFPPAPEWLVFLARLHMRRPRLPFAITPRRWRFTAPSRD